VDTLLHIGLSNAVAAGALAVLAGAVGYFCRRPAVRHALWLLVLLKLVTPPLVDIRIWRPADLAPVAEETAAAPAVELVALAPDDDPAPDEGAEPPAADADRGAELAVVAAEPEEEPAALPLAGRPEKPTIEFAVELRTLALAVWLGGAFVWLAVAALRAGRFGRLLRHAGAAPPGLQREADQLARRLGLACAPPIRMLPGRVSPMLWAPGWSAALLLPADLLERLDPAGRRTLLAHELAHLRRRDHRVRQLELLVTALFWWHPVVWWARRELHDAEEQCCDAWVLWALPQAARTYALALVETVDFLSEAPPALPALASGVGHVHDLRRRVTMIMQGTTPRALTWRGVLGLLGLGAFLLPVMPSWAQEEEQPPVRFRVVPDAKAEDVKTVVGEAELQRLLAELKKKQAELEQLQVQVEAAKKRAAQPPAAAAKDGEKRIIIEIVDGDKRQVITLPPGSKVGGDPVKAKIDAALEMKKARDVLEKRVIELRAAETAKEKDKEKEKARGLVIEIISDGKRQVIELPPGSRVIGGGGADVIQGHLRILQGGQTVPVLPRVPTPPQPGAPAKGVDVKDVLIVRPGQSADTEKRLVDLERRLEELLRAVKELHGEMKGKGGLQLQPMRTQPGAPPGGGAGYSAPNAPPLPAAPNRP
jgi:beta-lactamase regulating signal transducer with metallopeptidase domain